MEEVINEEDIPPAKCVDEEAEMNPTALRIKEKEDFKTSPFMDDDVEEDFELISADELSLHEDA